ncbi:MULTISPECIES: hypothetical protein [unclassified Lentimonas]|uniref:hypothetical protein n=1 Tax=unclassified Lentimonas TaxID=2630993 RepID=UPI0013288DC4|nr:MULTISPECIES: hypothetical protein [unclassified Lentimonas]CAA6677070.1 Unannotated [Lentimonas sp. CC4]CAA6687265.1 Unannotated [Lentimonas sp. CC6]CAA7074336.1 Unannotated [Lentimonas sp. CC4]CAA7171434.1 Unannotated [Lentimonas sp. CC21]CAA7180070.1 Unannotated [Lentimonas sp. CC8]
MQTQHQAWHSNLKSKVNEIQKLGVSFITSKENRLGSESQKQQFESLQEKIELKFEGLSSMYGPNMQPPNLVEARHKFKHFKGNLIDPVRLSGYFKALEALPQILVEAEKEISFDEIFEKYKEDKRLNELVQELIELLEQILNEGDDYLTPSTHRDLQKIIHGLKQRKKSSINEINVWVDWSIRLCLSVVDGATGVPVATPIYEAIKIGKEAKVRMMTCHEEAQLTLAKNKGMKRAEKVLIDTPSDISDEELTKKIEPPK